MRNNCPAGDLPAHLRIHRTALIALVVVALILSLAGLAAGDVEAALLPWALPAAVLIGLAWEARQ